MSGSTEQALRMVRAGVTWEFPPIPGDLDIWASQGGQGVATETDFSAGTGASYRKPVTALPAGFVKCWDLPANGSISVTLPVDQIAGGTLRLTFRIWNRTTGVDTFGAGYEVAWESSGTPLPSSSVYTTVTPAKAGTFSDLGAWQLCTFDIKVPATATSAAITVTGEDQNQRTYLLGVTVEPVAERETVTWGCGAARDGHLDGLWSLPAMQGEILENVLYGGGLAPANPTWGPRPVTYVLYLTGLARPAVMNEIKRFTGFLSSGPLTVWHHSYGICENGFLAAPPEVEWRDYAKPLVKIVLTLTFLDPRIWSILRHDSASLVEWVAQNWTRAAYEDVFTVWSGAIEPPQPGEGGLPPTQVPVSNGSGAPVYPLIAWKAKHGAGDPGVVGVFLRDGGTTVGVAMWSVNATGEGALYVADMATLKVYMLQNGVMNDTWATVISTSGSWELAPGQQAVIDFDTDQSPYMNVDGVASVAFQASM